MPRTHSRYIPHGLGEHTVRWTRFVGWLTEQRLKGRTMLHLLSGSKGITVFALTPQEYALFPTEQIVRQIKVA